MPLNLRKGHHSSFKENNDTKGGGRRTEFVYVGDDRFALLQVRRSEAVDGQHDERRTDETEGDGQEVSNSERLNVSCMFIYHYKIHFNDE